MEWRRHPPIDGLRIGCGGARADINVAVLPGDIARGGVLRVGRALTVCDLPGLHHVGGVEHVAGAERGVLAECGLADACAPGVQAIKPRASRRQLRIDLDVGRVRRRVGQGGNGEGAHERYRQAAYCRRSHSGTGERGQGVLGAGCHPVHNGRGRWDLALATGDGGHGIAEFS